MTSTTTQHLRDQYPEVSRAHPEDAEFQVAVDRHRTAMKDQFGTFVEDKGLVDLIAAQPDFAGFYDEAGPDAGEVNLHDFVNEAEAALAAARGRVNALRRRVDAEQDFTVGAVWLPETRRSIGSVTRPYQGRIEVTVSGVQPREPGRHAVPDKTVSLEWWNASDDDVTMTKIEFLPGEARSIAALLIGGADKIDRGHGD